MAKRKRRTTLGASSKHRREPLKAESRIRVSAEALPRRSLRDVRFIAETLHSTYAGKSATWDELCEATDISKTSNDTKYKFWSALAYGIIAKDEADENNSGQLFSLSETGRKIVAPTYDGEDKEAIRKAVLNPTVLSKFYSDYDGHPVPSDTHFPNVLETKFSVPRSRTGEAIEIIKDNGKLAGMLVPGLDGGLSVRLTGNAAGRDFTTTADTTTEAGAEEAQPTTPPIVDWDKICFYITPIGDDGSENRKHADMLLRHLLEPVATEHGLTVIRADKIDRSGLITQQIFEYLAKARLCLADLSFSNANAFYELGVRHTCKRPTIQIIRKGDRIPFDVSQGRTIVVDTSDVYTVMDRFESARRELSEYINHALNTTGDISDDNPVNVYLPKLRISLT